MLRDKPCDEITKAYKMIFEIQKDEWSISNTKEVILL